MADIDIVPKHRSRTWLWVLLAIVLIALFAWMVMGGGDTAPQGVLTVPGDSNGLETLLAMRA
jgi:hypothetical protein